uniref:6-cysteine protein n=1 Tax=Strongyloides venezuelensis TaxID=75913 RepID=A0A0K0F4C8_STRVS
MLFTDFNYGRLSELFKEIIYRVGFTNKDFSYPNDENRPRVGFSSSISDSFELNSIKVLKFHIKNMKGFKDVKANIKFFFYGECGKKLKNVNIAMKNYVNEKIELHYVDKTVQCSIEDYNEVDEMKGFFPLVSCLYHNWVGTAFHTQYKVKISSYPYFQNHFICRKLLQIDHDSVDIGFKNDLIDPSELKEKIKNKAKHKITLHGSEIKCDGIKINTKTSFDFLNKEYILNSKEPIMRYSNEKFEFYHGQLILEYNEVTNIQVDKKDILEVTIMKDDKNKEIPVVYLNNYYKEKDKIKNVFKKNNTSVEYVGNKHEMADLTDVTCSYTTFGKPYILQTKVIHYNNIINQSDDVGNKILDLIIISVGVAALIIIRIILVITFRIIKGRKKVRLLSKASSACDASSMSERRSSKLSKSSMASKSGSKLLSSRSESRVKSSMSLSSADKRKNNRSKTRCKISGFTG